MQVDSTTTLCVLADYGFEYSEDDEPEEDEQIETENTYYGAKGELLLRCAYVVSAPRQVNATALWSLCSRAGRRKLPGGVGGLPKGGGPRKQREGRMVRMPRQRYARISTKWFPAPTAVFCAALEHCQHQF